MRDILYFIVTGLLSLYCLITFCRMPKGEWGDNADRDRGLWLVGAMAAWLWPVGLAGYLLYLAAKGFERAVLIVFGPIEIKQAIEQIPDVIGSIPDTLLEKFQELEKVAKQKTCTHGYGHVVIDGIRCCSNCHTNLEYMWGKNG